MQQWSTAGHVITRNPTDLEADASHLTLYAARVGSHPLPRALIMGECVPEQVHPGPARAPPTQETP